MSYARSERWAYVGAAVAAALAFALAMAVALGGCVVAGTRGCTPWKIQEGDTECRACPTWTECRKPRPKAKRSTEYFEDAAAPIADTSTSLAFHEKFNPACGAFLDVVACPEPKR